MIIFVNDKGTKLCQIILRIKRFTDERKVVSLFLPLGVPVLLFSTFCCIM